MLRIQFPGALYHVVNRGDRGEAIFRDDIDRERFIETLGEAAGKTGWRIIAFCLMPDHFHLALETPDPNLVDGMKWFLGTYTARFNRRHGSAGHVFSGRYRSQILDPALPLLQAEVAAYLHFNPVRAGLVPSARDAADFAWSSYRHYLAGEPTRPAWLSVDAVFREVGLSDDESGRLDLRSWQPAQVCEPGASSWNWLRTGWFAGGPAFRRDLLDRLESQRAPGSRGLVWKASAEQQAEKSVQRKLEELGWDPSELMRRAKTDAGKVLLAKSLRQETTMTLGWIASRLHMGTRNTLRNALLAQPGPVFKSTPAEHSAPIRHRTSPPPESSSSLAFEPGWD